MNITTAILYVVSGNDPMRPLLHQHSHALLTLGRNTVLQVLIQELVAAGADRIFVLTAPEGTGVRQIVEAMRDNGMADAEGTGPAVDLQWVSHQSGGGCGAALLEARSFVEDEPFMLATTEAPICHPGQPGSLLSRMSATWQATGADAVVAVRDSDAADPSGDALIEAVGDPSERPHFVVAGLSDPPSPMRAGVRMKLMSRHILTPLVFDYLEEQPRASGQMPSLPRALNRMARDRGAVWAVSLQNGEICFDLSSFLLYSRAFIQFSLKDPEVGTAVHDYLRTLVGG